MALFSNDRAADEALADGIYFNLPEGAYHALPRLSASGIKSILTSLPTFWAKSWMNPEAEGADGDDTKSQILGRAYHAAIFEPNDLHKRFVSAPDLDGFTGMLATDAAVKAELKEHGAAQTKGGETVLDRARRLERLGSAKPIKSIIMDEFENNLDGRQTIAPKYWRQIMRDVERIRANPEIHDLVTGGASEVTILWTCPDTEIPMKARIDKLKSEYFVDLKSFSNANGKPVNQAIANQVQYYRYYLSMRVYQVAISMIRKLSLPVMDLQDDDPMHQMIDALDAKDAPHQPWLFFQEKNGVPNLLARRLRLQTYPMGVEEQLIGVENHGFKMSDSVLCHKADIEIARAKQLFKQAMEVYGDGGDPWMPFDMISDIGDGDFREYFLDSTPA